MTYLEKRQRAAKRNNNGLLVTSSLGLIASITAYTLEGNFDYLLITAISNFAFLIALATRNK